MSSQLEDTADNEGSAMHPLRSMFQPWCNAPGTGQALNLNCLWLFPIRKEIFNLFLNDLRYQTMEMLTSSSDTLSCSTDGSLISQKNLSGSFHSRRSFTCGGPASDGRTDNAKSIISVNNGCST